MRKPYELQNLLVTKLALTAGMPCFFLSLSFSLFSLSFDLQKCLLITLCIQNITWFKFTHCRKTNLYQDCFKLFAFHMKLDCLNENIHLLHRPRARYQRDVIQPDVSQPENNGRSTRRIHFI